MILWISGNSGAGKTTLSDLMESSTMGHNYIVQLDGDEMRNTICKDLGFSDEDRRENNLRIARLAKLIHEQGFDVIVSVIAPSENVRDEIRIICDPVFFYLLDYEGTRHGVDFPYDEPNVDKKFVVSIEE